LSLSVEADTLNSAMKRLQPEAGTFLVEGKVETIEKDTVLASSPRGLLLTCGVQVPKMMLIIFHKTYLLYIGQF